MFRQNDWNRLYSKKPDFLNLLDLLEMTSFSQVHKYFLQLLLMYVLLLLGGYLLISFVKLNLYFIDIAILSTTFSIIAFITILIFLRGRTREPDSQTLHSLTSVSLKFLMEMLLALVWFIVAKKTSMASVLMFFVLYLTITLFTICIILKTLKNRVL